MSAKKKVLTGFFLMCSSWAGTACADSPAYFFLGVGGVDSDMSYSGSAGGSLSSHNAFSGGANPRSAVLSLGFGREIWDSARGFSVDAEASVAYQALRTGFDDTWSFTAQQTVDTCYPPPPFVPSPGYCVSFGTTVRSFTETQQIHTDVSSTVSAQGRLRASYEVAGKKFWVGAGPEFLRRKIHWAMPPVNSFKGPVPTFITVGIPPLPTVASSLPAQVSLPAAEGTSSVWVVGAGYSLGMDQPVIGGRLLRLEIFGVDWPTERFSNASRLENLSVSARSRGVRLVYLF